MTDYVLMNEMGCITSAWSMQTAHQLGALLFIV